MSKNALTMIRSLMLQGNNNNAKVSKLLLCPVLLVYLILSVAWQVNTSLSVHSQSAAADSIINDAAVVPKQQPLQTSNTDRRAAQNTKSRKSLQKPIPNDLMCSEVHESQGGCQVRPCTSINGTDSTTTTPTVPSFIKSFPAAHYGYGFISRSDQKRGLRMQVSGTAASGSGCALSHEYKFIFVHVLKSGGTTVKGFLQDGLCGNTQIPCAKGDHVLKIVDCGKAIAQYPQYFVFSFVRNPFSRMYSAYAMAHSYRNHPTKPRPPFSFDSFVLGHVNSNTTAIATIPKQQQQAKTTKEKYSFRQQLSYLHPSHYVPQTFYLFSPKGCPVVDYVGHLETMLDDLKVILTYLESPELWQEYDKREAKHLRNLNANNNNNNSTKTATTLHSDNSTAFGNAKKQSELGGNLQTAYHYNSNNTNSHNNVLQQAVVSEYQRDFHLLGYDSRTVPT